MVTQLMSGIRDSNDYLLNTKHNNASKVPICFSLFGYINYRMYSHDVVI